MKLGFDLNLDPEDGAFDDVIDFTLQHDEQPPMQGTRACSFMKLVFFNVHAFVRH